MAADHVITSNSMLIKVVKSLTNHDLNIHISGNNTENTLVIPARSSSFDLGAYLSSEDLWDIQPNILDLVNHKALAILSYAPALTYDTETSSGNVPPSLLSDVATLKMQMAAVQLQLANSIVQDVAIDASKVDNVHSTISIDINGNFTLPTFTPQVYWQDALSGTGTLNPAHYSVNTGSVNGVGNPVVMENGALTCYSVAEGIYESIVIPTAVAADPLPADWSIAFDLIWSSVTPTGGDFQLMIGDGGDGHAFGRLDHIIDGVRDDAGNIQQLGFQFVNIQSGNSVLSANVSVTSLGLNCMNPGGAVIPLKFVFAQGLLSIYVNGVLSAQGQDPTAYVGTAYNNATFLFGPGGFGPQIGWHPEILAMNNLVIQSPQTGTYGASGVMQSLPLTSLAPILHFAVGFNETLPSLSTASMAVSADAGAHWTTVTSGEVVDCTTLTGGPSTSMLVKLSLASTDGTHATTPLVGPVVASISKV